MFSGLPQPNGFAVTDKSCHSEFISESNDNRFQNKFGMTNHKKTAFTLSEVLIALVVIGVIAAITVPTVIENTREKETVSKVKKAFSVMNSAYRFAVKDYGPIDSWNYQKGQAYNESFAYYFKKYLNVIKYCPGANGGCLADTNYKYMNNQEWSNYETSNWHTKMILNDGMTIWLRSEQDYNNDEACITKDQGHQNTCGIIWVDVNGKRKPNTIGRDTFVFAILRDGIVPSKIDDCKKGGNGWGCSQHILTKNNMNYPS